MGSPVTAVAWLAREVARRGKPLVEGEVVLSGALGPLVTVPGPGSYRARLDGMGSVDAVFVAQVTE
jgi:2-keto-4-pentenoate hydratase